MKVLVSHGAIDRPLSSIPHGDPPHPMSHPRPAPAPDQSDNLKGLCHSGNPRPAAPGPRFPVPAESGNGDSLFPDSRPIGNRESGDPPQTGKTRGGIRLSHDSRPDSRPLLVFRQWTRSLVVDVPWHQRLGRHRPRSPPDSPPDSAISRRAPRRPSRHPPLLASAGPSLNGAQFKKEGGRPEYAFETPNLGNIQPRIVPAVLTRRGSIPDFPICGQSGPRFPFPPAESVNGGFPIPDSGRIVKRGDSLPVSRPNRKSGERELGISRRVWGPALSDTGMQPRASGPSPMWDILTEWNHEHPPWFHTRGSLASVVMDPEVRLKAFKAAFYLPVVRFSLIRSTYVIRSFIT
jgi:hypothetical protein